MLLITESIDDVTSFIAFITFLIHLVIVKKTPDSNATLSKFINLLASKFSNIVDSVSMNLLPISDTVLPIFSPIDIIPDCIPGVGLVDDAAMVGFCLAAARSDIEDFRVWARAHL